MNWQMKPFNTAKSSWLLLSLCLLTACTQSEAISKEALPYYSDASFTPHWFAASSDSLADFHKIPTFRLLNQDGDTLSEQSVAGKIYVADFFFTSCPGICPKMTANLAVVQAAFQEDEEVLLLSHSVTPETDSVYTLQKYAQAKGVISGKWHLLTGDRSEIYRLGRRSYFVEEDLGEEKDEDEFLHTENFVLIDQNRHIRGIYNGLNKTAVQQLIADIQLLKKKG